MVREQVSYIRIVQLKHTPYCLLPGGFLLTLFMTIHSFKLQNTISYWCTMRFFTTFATFAVTFATCNAAIGQDTYQNRGVRVQVPFGAPSSSHNSCDRPPRTTTVTEVVDGVTVTVPAGGHPLSWLSQETPAASDDEPVTMTTTTHHTRFMYEVVATKTMILPWAVQTSNAGQKEDNCDRTACESCSLFYGCDNGEPAW